MRKKQDKAAPVKEAAPVRKMTLTRPLLLVMLLSFLEPALIIAGMLPQIFSYSIGNILFSTAVYAVVAYVAFSRAGEGLAKAALNGAVLGFTNVSITCASGLAGADFYGRPVLGIGTDVHQMLIVIILAVIVGNTLLATILSVLMAWLARRFGRHCQ